MILSNRNKILLFLVLAMAGSECRAMYQEEDDYPRRKTLYSTSTSAYYPQEHVVMLGSEEDYPESWAKRAKNIASRVASKTGKALAPFYTKSTAFTDTGTPGTIASYMGPMGSRYLGIGYRPLAISMGITVGTLAYLAKAYGGLAPAIVAWRFSIPRGRDAMLLQDAYKHDSDALKYDMTILNETLLGRNWREKRAHLVNDFVELDRIRFIRKHGAKAREQILYLLNIYAAANALYFKKYDIASYLQPYFFTSTGSKQKSMHELDKELGIE